MDRICFSYQLSQGNSVSPASFIDSHVSESPVQVLLSPQRWASTREGSEVPREQNLRSPPSQVPAVHLHVRAPLICPTCLTHVPALPPLSLCPAPKSCQSSEIPTALPGGFCHWSVSWRLDLIPVMSVHHHFFSVPNSKTNRVQGFRICKVQAAPPLHSSAFYPSCLETPIYPLESIQKSWCIVAVKYYIIKKKVI